MRRYTFRLDTDFDSDSKFMVANLKFHSRFIKTLIYTIFKSHFLLCEWSMVNGSPRPYKESDSFIRFLIIFIPLSMTIRENINDKKKQYFLLLLYQIPFIRYFGVQLDINTDYYLSGGKK